MPLRDGWCLQALPTSLRCQGNAGLKGKDGCLTGKFSYFTAILLRRLLLHPCISPGEPGPHLPPPARVKLRGGFCQHGSAASLLLPAVTFTSALGTARDEHRHKQFTSSAWCHFYTSKLDKPAGILPLNSPFPSEHPSSSSPLSFLCSKFSNPSFCKVPVAEWLGFGLYLCQVRRFCRRERGRCRAGRKVKGKREEQQRGGSLLNHQLIDTARCCAFLSTVSSCETLILSII